MLEAFDVDNSSLTVAHIARCSGLPLATVYLIVTELVELGLLERGAGCELRVGVRLCEIASVTPPALGLREAVSARGITRALAQGPTGTPVLSDWRNLMTGSTLPADGGLPSVVVQRRVEWQDTDAAGHHHHGAVLRWVESAETVLLERLAATELYGRSPRVHYDVDYHHRVYYGQIVHIELRVERVGDKSVRYEFAVRDGEVVVATGHLVVVMASHESPGAVALPSSIREALTTGGPQRPEIYG